MCAIASKMWTMYTVHIFSISMRCNCKVWNCARLICSCQNRQGLPVPHRSTYPMILRWWWWWHKLSWWWWCRQWWRCQLWRNSYGMTGVVVVTTEAQSTCATGAKPHCFTLCTVLHCFAICAVLLCTLHCVFAVCTLRQTALFYTLHFPVCTLHCSAQSVLLHFELVCALLLLVHSPL